MFGPAGPTENNVYRYREDGTYLGTVGKGGETTQGIALGPDGDLYVVSNNVGSGNIARYNPVTGASLGNLVTNDSAYEIPNGITFGADGYCYSTSQQFRTGVTGVVRFDGTSGSFQGVAIAPGDNGLGTPTNVLRGTGNDLFVTDGSRINRYDGTTLGFKTAFVSPGEGGLSAVTSYGFGPDGNLYVSSFNQNAIYRFDGNTGAFIDEFIPLVTGPGGFTFGNDGDLYVVSFGNSVTVQRFDGTNGTSLGTLIGPSNETQMGWYLITAPDLPEPAAMSFAAAICALGLRRRRRV